MKYTNRQKGVEILDEDLNLETRVTAKETKKVTQIYPEHYEDYLGDGVYLNECSPDYERTLCGQF